MLSRGSVDATRIKNDHSATQKAGKVYTKCLFLLLTNQWSNVGLQQIRYKDWLRWLYCRTVEVQLGVIKLFIKVLRESILRERLSCGVVFDIAVGVWSKISGS